MDWLIWLGAALTLGIVEILVMDPTVLMLIGGALAGVVTAAIGAPIWAQFLVAGVTSFALVGFMRPWAMRVLKRTPELHLGTDGHIGRRAVALTELTTTSGRVKLEGEVWSARVHDPTGGAHPPPPIPAGAEVLVTAIDGATAVVFPTTDLLPEAIGPNELSGNHSGRAVLLPSNDDGATFPPDDDADFIATSPVIP
ncbi:MAG: NfeD family protein [Promicromonosporaceae bacterium]|nr:NfeD family protein [Promicromonosporaceae bacterium]